MRLSDPIIQILRICLICPKAFLGKTENTRILKYFSLQNCFCIISMIVYNLVFAYFLFQEPMEKSIDVVWTYVAISVSWYKTFIIIYFLYHQKPLNSILNYLERTPNVCKIRNRVKILMIVILMLVFVISNIILAVVEKNWTVFRFTCYYYNFPWMCYIMEITCNFGFVFCFFILTTVMILFFCIICLMFALNVDEIFNMGTDINSSVDNLLEVFQKMKQLSSLLKQFNDLYSPILFAWCLEVGIAIGCGVPSLLLNHKLKETLEHLTLALTLHNFALLICLSLSASSIQLHLQDLQSRVLNSIPEAGSSLQSKKLFQEKMLMYDMLRNVDMQISVAGFVKIDRKLLLTLLLNTITISVVIVDMST